MILGIDYLGGANYGNVILKNHPPGFAAGFILNTNKPEWPKTNCWPVIEALLKKGSDFCPLVRVHAVWDDGHKYQPKIHDPIISHEFVTARGMAAQYGSDIQFSWMCENNMTREQNALMVSRYSTALLELVNSVYKGAPVAGSLLEVHAPLNATGEHNFSYDGQDCLNSNVLQDMQIHRDAKVFWLWTDPCNGHVSGKDDTPRNKRDYWLFAKKLNAMAALAKDPGAINLSKKYLYKAVAEDSGMGDWKDNKPCIIIPDKGTEVLFRTQDGTVIAKAPYYGTFSSGGYRYYAKSWGYEIAEKAFNLQGLRSVDLVFKGKVLGSVSPAFRAGRF